MIVVGGESGNGLLDDVQVKISWSIKFIWFQGVDILSFVFLQLTGA